MSQGIDPLAEKRRTKIQAEQEAARRARTFEVVAREWYEKRTVNLTAHYRRQILLRMERHLFPHIGAIPMMDLDLPDIVEALRHIEGTADMGRRIAQIAGQICRYARLMKYARYDVSSGVTDALPKKEIVKHRAAVTKPEDIGQLLRAINAYRGDISVVFALRIMSYVFVRSTELRNASWEEIDLEKSLWVIPAGRMKMRVPHVVPLAKQVVKLFEELQKWTGNGALVFPSPFSATRCISDMGLLNALRRMGYGKEDMTIHGLRGMASTLLNEQGYRPDVIEAQLAHGERNAIRAAYNHAQYMDERRRMMQDWTDYLDGLRAGK